MELTPTSLARRCPPHKRLWLALSGGLDSTALLHLLWRADLKPQAIHVNHQLQPAAGSWAEHCRALCEQWELPFELRTVGVLADAAAGPEAAARAARYEALRGLLKAGDVLVTAHHRGDQAETVLLRLLRGAGVTGLAAMRELSEFPPARLWRPLLGVPRDLVRAYADAQRLQWIEDPHNGDPRYARSYLRAEIMPRLQARWSAAEETLARTAAHAAEARDLLQELAHADAAGLKTSAGLSVKRLLALSAPRRHNLLRGWIEDAGFELPAAAALERVDAEVLGARQDAAPVLVFGTAELRRYRDSLCLMRKLPPAPQAVELFWRTGRRLDLPEGCGELLAGASPPQPVRICFARGGERFKPSRSRHTRTLKNLFQEAGVPPWVRERTPLLYGERRLLWVGGIGWTAGAKPRFDIRWRHTHV
jgi:tRNA(Ile)-lysidine synthase